MIILSGMRQVLQRPITIDNKSAQQIEKVEITSCKGTDVDTSTVGGNGRSCGVRSVDKGIEKSVLSINM